MSLYSFEEICEGCNHAVLHECDKCKRGESFCHCERGLEDSADHTDGTCKAWMEK